jgi:N-acetylmuramoyl-L-alanine amidase
VNVGAFGSVMIMPRAVQLSQPQHNTTPPPAPSWTKTLRVGDSGPAVSELQQRLRSMGYAVDTGGTFTRETHHAVMAFQKVNGLIRDGIVGPQTRGALANPRQPDIGRGEADRIVVDLSDQVAYVVNNGRLDFIVNVSTGDPNHPDGLGVATRKGTFRVYRRSAGTYHGTMGTIYWPAFFDGGIALHGSKSVPAYPASHGCVRVPMHLAERVYREATRGSQVIVRD